jgi:hypothetical protein
VNHLGHRASQCHENRLLVQFSARKLVEWPLHLDVSVALGTVVPVWLDHHAADAGTDVDRHEGMAGFVVCGDFRHGVLSGQVHPPDGEVQDGGETHQ